MWPDEVIDSEHHTIKKEDKKTKKSNNISFHFFLFIYLIKMIFFFCAPIIKWNRNIVDEKKCDYNSIEKKMDKNNRKIKPIANDSMTHIREICRLFEISNPNTMIYICWLVDLLTQSKRRRKNEVCEGKKKKTANVTQHRKSQINQTNGIWYQWMRFDFFYF